MSKGDEDLANSVAHSVADSLARLSFGDFDHASSDDGSGEGSTEEVDSFVDGVTLDGGWEGEQERGEQKRIDRREERGKNRGGERERRGKREENRRKKKEKRRGKRGQERTGVRMRKREESVRALENKSACVNTPWTTTSPPYTPALTINQLLHKLPLQILQEELFRSHLERLFTSGFKVFFLTDIGHERVHFVSLLDEPDEDTRGVWKARSVWVSVGAGARRREVTHLDLQSRPRGLDPFSLPRRRW
jgi:hypothetical protein